MAYPDKLYELAFALRKAKPWKTLFDSELFALSLPDGEIGYCSVMGFLGEHLAIALYVGDRGLDCYRLLQDMNEMMNPMNLMTMANAFNPLKLRESMLSQDCLQCSFSNKDELHPQELANVRKYTSAHKITLRGANSFPQFIRYRPARYPWPVTEEGDIQLLIAALEAVLEVCERLKSSHKKQLGFQEGPMYGREIPLLTPSGTGFSWSRYSLPPARPQSYPELVLEDELLLTRLKRLKKRCGTWLCDVVMTPQPCVGEEMETPAFPYMLLAADYDSGTVIPSEFVMDYEDGAKTLLQSLGSQMQNRGIPQQIIVVDKRTHSLLRNLAKELKIQLTQQESDDLLDQLEEDLLEYMDDDDSGETSEGRLFDMLMSLKDSELLSMPDELWNQLMDMDASGLLPKDLSERLRALSERMK